MGTPVSIVWSTNWPQSQPNCETSCSENSVTLSFVPSMLLKTRLLMKRGASLGFHNRKFRLVAGTGGEVDALLADDESAEYRGDRIGPKARADGAADFERHDDAVLLVDVDRDRRRAARGEPVGHRVGERVGADVPLVRGVDERPALVPDERPVPRLLADDREEGVAVRVGVVAEQPAARREDDRDRHMRGDTVPAIDAAARFSPHSRKP